ncbi:MAG: palindromic element RPE4 domain-containing protein [Rickettsia conorii subsp. raoultii]|nr:hypothetical protein RRIM16_06320 [Rickettsia conorii subsp. raoultii]
MLIKLFFLDPAVKPRDDTDKA